MLLSSLIARPALFVSGCIAVAAIAVGPAASLAQNSVQLFGPVNVRLSANGTGYGSSTDNFNSTTLNLNCAASPITAVLSSSADGTGNLLVDNNINVTVTAAQTTTGPTNICVGSVNGSSIGPFQNCFTSGYQNPASAGSLTGQNPDNFVATGGVAPIDISATFVPGPIQVKIDLADEGGYLTNSSLYLKTNCSSAGVTGPALISGNPISTTSPTGTQLAQGFDFNSNTDQLVGFDFDLTEAQNAGTLSITDGTIPQVSDSPIDPATFQSVLVPQTSFATSICLVHSGETLSNGQPACKLYTLECKVGTGATATGAQCPVSTQPNEIFRDTFDGPAFTLPDIPTPNGPTFHQGVGFLMAKENWTGGPCTFDPASGLQNLPCPQNLLTSFTGPGTYAGTARTTHPNSTFITVAQVPEPLTTVSVAGQQPGGWINSSTATLTLSTQPPILANSGLPSAANFVPSPISTLTYGISPADSLPPAGLPVPGDTVLTNSTGCPSPATPGSPAASVYNPGTQTLSGLTDGRYLLHYYAQDCAGTEELKFTQDGTGSWSTSFYTYAINVDTAAPVVATGPTLSPAPPASGSYTVGDVVSANFSCSDSLSGVTKCGSYTYAPGSTTDTGNLSTVVDTSTPGSKTFTVAALDAAGNQASASVTYQVVAPASNPVQFTITPQTVTYPQGANAVVKILPGVSSNALARTARSNYQTPNGTVKILDGTKVLDILRLQGDGAAYDYIQGLSAGQHSLTASYSGDASTPAGVSAPVIFTVKPAPVRLDLACWNSNFRFGGDYYCGAYASSDAGPPRGVITYKLDNGAAKTVSLDWGIAIFTVGKPSVGQHTVSVSYAAQTNYAAAGPKSVTFTVTPAPVNVSLQPSSWYVTGGSLTLSASVASWSAGPPQATGAVTFSDGSRVLAVVPVNAAGRASLSLTVAGLANGTHNFTAAYGGGTNYGTGSAAATVTVAHR